MRPRAEAAAQALERLARQHPSLWVGYCPIFLRELSFFEGHFLGGGDSPSATLAVQASDPNLLVLLAKCVAALPALVLGHTEVAAAGVGVLVQAAPFLLKLGSLV